MFDERDGQMYDERTRQRHVYTTEFTDERTVETTTDDRTLDSDRTFGQANRRKNGRTQTGGRADKPRDGWTDGQTDKGPVETERPQAYGGAIDKRN